MTTHDTTTNQQGEAPPAPPSPPMPKIARRFTESDPNRPEANKLLPLVGLFVFFALIAWRWGWQPLVVIAGLIVMIFLHELGHYVMAKRAGMKVTEFFLGFGPRIWSFRRGETEYGVKALWLGAYVRIVGMHNLEEVAPEDEPRAYRQQPFRHRFGVAMAGSTMHFVLALVLMWSVFVFNGAPSNGLFRGEDDRDWTIEQVTEASAAERAGLQPGDRIVAFNGTRVEGFSELRELIEPAKGREVTLTILRDGRERNVATTIGENPENSAKGFLGVGPSYPDVPFEKANPVAAMPKAVGDFGFLSWESVKGIADKFSPAGLADLASRVFDTGTDEAEAPGTPDPNNQNQPAPSTSSEEDNDRIISILGAIGIGSDIADSGWAGLVVFLAAINVFIGFINLIPLLPFDGGHVAIAIYEKIRSIGRRTPYHADITKMLPITYGVFMVLAFVGLSSIYLDIVDPVSLN